MAVAITSVIKNSPAWKKHIQPGDILIAVNGHSIRDFLDYQFYIKDSDLTLELTRGGKIRFVRLSKGEEEDPGLEFASYLMDEQKHCRNKCIFCFIDQLPKGMRETLYFKDDDSRLSFLFGNYITLTNLTDSDVQRIIDMHISPVNISVHTMNPDLRVKMMSNKNAGKSLAYIGRLASGGIKLNTQLVLCPGINDGDELRRSLHELSALYPAVQSIACVPVGVTKYRTGLFPMTEYTKETAGETIDIIESFGEDFKKKHGTRLAYAADEFYLKAQREMPSGEYYENYCQIENGVGMWTSLREEFADAMNDYDGAEPKGHSAFATGTAAYPLIRSLADEFCRKYKQVTIDVYEIVNDFFGHSITVAGLVTGGDLIAQLRGKIKAPRLVIPDVMLRADGDLFLDDVTLDQVSRELGVTLETVGCSGEELFAAFCGGTDQP